MTHASIWHRRPEGFDGECPICGCPENGKGEHRITIPSDNLGSTWISRRKSGEGWRYKAIWPPQPPKVKAKGDAAPLPSLDMIPDDAKATAMGHVALKDYYVGHFERLHLRSKAFNTKRMYRTTLKKLAEHLGRAPVLADLNDDTISDYLATRSEEGLAPDTVQKESNNLCAIWRFASRRGDVGGWPSIEPETCPRRVPEAWTVDQMRALLRSCEKERGHYVGVPAGQWWVALVHVLWITGERIGAASGLLWSHVDLERGFITVPAELRKGRREDRCYKISDETISALKAIRSPERDEVFPWPYSEKYIYHILNIILHCAGLPKDARCKFHRIRRTVASLCEAAGGNATALLGHSTRKVTLAYLDPKIVPTPQATDYLPRLGDEENKPE